MLEQTPDHHATGHIHWEMVLTLLKPKQTSPTAPLIAHRATTSTSQPPAWVGCDFSSVSPPWLLAATFLSFLCLPRPSRMVPPVILLRLCAALLRSMMLGVMPGFVAGRSCAKWGQVSPSRSGVGLAKKQAQMHPLETLRL